MPCLLNHKRNVQLQSLKRNIQSQYTDILHIAIRFPITVYQNSKSRVYDAIDVFKSLVYSGAILMAYVW